MISIHDDRWLSKPGGRSRWRTRCAIEKGLVRYSQDRDNPPRETLGSKQDHIYVSEGDLLGWVTWGGGGWGHPYKRDADVVSLEVQRGLVSIEGAKRYGVVLRSDQASIIKAPRR